MDASVSAVITAVIAAVVAVWSAWLGFKREKGRDANENRSLSLQEMDSALTTQGHLIDRLEKRVADLEADVEECHRMRDRYRGERDELLRMYAKGDTR